MDAKQRLAVLRSEWRDCQKCELSHGRPCSIVFGGGNIAAKFLFIYDVPTDEDVMASSPLVGNAGTIFQDLLRNAKLDPAHVYKTPILGCRPTALIPATDDMPERIVDRAATADEVKACKARVDSIIYAVDPLLIFAMGELAWKTLVRPKDRGTCTSLDKAIGEAMVTYVPGVTVPEIRYPVMPLPSIKQIVASPSMARHGTIGVTLRHIENGKSYVALLKKDEQQDLADLQK